MACVQPDGFLTRCGEFLLLAMWKPATPEEVAKACRVPLFRVRSAIREFLQAGFVQKEGEAYVVTPDGIAVMEG